MLCIYEKREKALKTMIPGYINLKMLKRNVKCWPRIVFYLQYKKQVYCLIQDGFFIVVPMFNMSLVQSCIELDFAQAIISLYMLKKHEQRYMEYGKFKLIKSHARYFALVKTKWCWLKIIMSFVPFKIQNRINSKTVSIV